MVMKRVKLKCRGCGGKHFLTVDTENINIRKLSLNSCNRCPLEVRKRKFREISKRGMKAKKIRVKEIPGMKVLAEIRKIKSKRYGG